MKKASAQGNPLCLRGHNPRFLRFSTAQAYSSYPTISIVTPVRVCRIGCRSCSGFLNTLKWAETRQFETSGSVSEHYRIELRSPITYDQRLGIQNLWTAFASDSDRAFNQTHIRPYSGAPPIFVQAPKTISDTPPSLFARSVPLCYDIILLQLLAITFSSNNHNWR